jgi:hypothetical protein
MYIYSCIYIKIYTYMYIFIYIYICIIIDAYMKNDSDSSEPVLETASNSTCGEDSSTYGSSRIGVGDGAHMCYICSFFIIRVVFFFTCSLLAGLRFTCRG